MTAHACLKNEFTEDKKRHNLMSWLILYGPLVLNNVNIFLFWNILSYGINLKHITLLYVFLFRLMFWAGCGIPDDCLFIYIRGVFEKYVGWSIFQ